MVLTRALPASRATSLNRTGILAKLDHNEDRRYENADPSNDFPVRSRIVCGDASDLWRRVSWRAGAHSLHVCAGTRNSVIARKEVAFDPSERRGKKMQLLPCFSRLQYRE
jgi:hypothetical protein